MKLFETVGLYQRTISKLKVSQIIWRLFYRVTKRKMVHLPKNSAFKSVSLPCVFLPKNDSHLGDFNFTFLNTPQYEVSTQNWYPTGASKLWIYNLHYMDFINSPKLFNKPDIVESIILNWCESVTDPNRPGWDPYVVSLRIINIVKWAWRENKREQWLLRLVEEHARYLEKNLEWHLRGNHLFANAKALLFSASFVRYEGSVARLYFAKKLILEQLAEQILSDGGHFERSPMYHAILLEDLLDIINLNQSLPTSVFNSKTETSSLIAYANLMYRWLGEMTHPDGEISYFNDSVMGIAPNLKQLKKYMSRLDLLDKKARLPHSVSQKTSNASGYYSWMIGDAKLIVDAGLIGPDFLPGHGHADELSFELSIANQRVFVNTGVSTYETCPERYRQRSTSAHNCIEIGGWNSSEVWSSFRVGRRAAVTVDRAFFSTKEASLVVSHDGYRHKTNGKCERQFRMVNGRLNIEDQVFGKVAEWCTRLHLAPKISCQLEKNKSSIKISGCSVDAKITWENANVEIGSFDWCAGFGEKIASRVIKLVPINQKLPVSTSVTWLNKKS